MTVIETLEPTVANPVRVTFTLNDGKPVTYEQKPLSFFGKMELFAVLGGALQEALSEDGGMSLKSLLDVPEKREENLSFTDFLDADEFVKVIAQLMQIAPDLLKDIFCISLAIPREAREYAKGLMEEQISDDDGIALLDGFVEQNWEVLKSFFSEKIAPLFEKMTQTAQDSAPSKPLKATPRRTRKRSANA